MHRTIKDEGDVTMNCDNESKAKQETCKCFQKKKKLGKDIHTLDDKVKITLGQTHLHMRTSPIANMDNRKVGNYTMASNLSGLATYTAMPRCFEASGGCVFVMAACTAGQSGRH